MTLICSKDDVDKLIGEMRHWGDDPDLRRIADALPIEVLEAAYVAKLDAEAPFWSQSWCTELRAKTGSQKLAIMRKIYAAWLRSPCLRLGQLLFKALDSPSNMGGGFEGEFFSIEDGMLAQAVQKRYLPPK